MKYLDQRHRVVFTVSSMDDEEEISIPINNDILLVNLCVVYSQRRIRPADVI